MPLKDANRKKTEFGAAIAKLDAEFENNEKPI